MQFANIGASAEREWPKRKLESHDASFEWQRQGLLLDDFDRFDLVNIPVKESDTRAARFLRTFGDRAAELDALRPDELHRRVRSVIEKYVDRRAWKRLQKTEHVERESLGLVRNYWDEALIAAQTAHAVNGDAKEQPR